MKFLTSILPCLLVVSSQALTGDAKPDSFNESEITPATGSTEDKFFSHIETMRDTEMTHYWRISRTDGILRQCFRILKQRRLKIRAVPDIQYEGEDGIDADGLTREFLTSAMAAVREGEDGLMLLEGEFPNLVPLHSTDLLASKVFFHVGQLIAYSIVHGGIPLVGLSPAVVVYVIHNDIDKACDAQDVADLSLRENIEKFQLLQLILTIPLLSNCIIMCRY